MGISKAIHANSATRQPRAHRDDTVVFAVKMAGRFHVSALDHMACMRAVMIGV